MAIEFKDGNDKNLTGIFIDINKLSSTNETLEKSYDFNNLYKILVKIEGLKRERDDYNAKTRLD